MMAPTHVATGTVLALPLLAVAPDLAPGAALAAMAGALVPDLDLLAGRHRRTLHFPVLYWLAALPAAALALAAPSTATVALAAALVSAAVHSGVDAFGGGLELRPWEATSDEGVYLHVRRRWLAPRRWIRYDGAPEDLALAAALSVPGLVAYGRTVRRATVAALAVAVIYTAVRKRLPDLLAALVE